MSDGDPSTVIVNVDELEDRVGADVDINVNVNVEDFLIPTGPPTTLKPEEDNALRQAVSDAWTSKQFSDVEVLCGVDGGTILSHRIVLASLSPFLRTALLCDYANCPHETSVVILPDVDSKILSHFLTKVSTGLKEFAVTHPSLAFLDFGHGPIVKVEDGVTFEQEFSNEFIEALGETDEIGNQKKSLIWKFFTRIDSSTKKCRTCDYTIKANDGNTSGMVRHVKREHPDIYRNTDFSNQFSFGYEGKKVNKKRSIVWTYFDKNERTVALCKICGKNVRTEGSNTSGMVRHLRRAHPELNVDGSSQSLTAIGDASEGFRDDNDDEAFEWPTDGEESMEIKMEPGMMDVKIKFRSKVWNYFERLNKSLSSCLNCEANINTKMGNTSGMSRHLKRFHPSIWHTLLTDDTDINYTDIDYTELDGAKGRLRSIVWNYFEREDSSTAVCSICKLSVKTGGGNTSGLARHLKRAHEAEYQHFLESTKALAENEPRTNEDENEEEVRDIWKFYTNVNTEEGSDHLNAMCNICETVVIFDSENFQNLEDHMSALHQDVLKESNGRGATRSAIWNFFKKTQIKSKNECLQCGKVMLCARQNTTSMIRHLERRHPDVFLQFLQESGNQEKAAKFEMEKPTIKTEFAATDISHRTCPDCHKVYWHKRAMLYHRKIVHSGERPFKCNVCNMTFARHECYLKHSHTNERKYLCSHCGKTFGRKSARDLHERAHRGDRRYSCSHCAKMFMTNQALTKHERIHTGEKPFQCKDCGKQFVQQHQLTTHIRIHTGEKPYSCDFCDLKFRHLSSKSKHKCEGKMIAVKWLAHPNEDGNVGDSE